MHPSSFARVGLPRRSSAVVSCLVVGILGTVVPAAAHHPPFVAPAPPKQMEIGEILDLRLVTCADNTDHAQSVAAGNGS